MELNNITKGKAVPLGVLIIVITYLVSGASSSILPFIFFTGIIMGIIKNSEVLEGCAAGLLAALIGSVIATIISIGLMYVSYGMTYVNYVLMSTIYMIIFYIIVGGIGGAIGHYIYKEIENN